MAAVQAAESRSGPKVAFARYAAAPHPSVSTWSESYVDSSSTTADVAAFNVAFPQVSRNRFFKLLSDGTLILPLSRLGELERQFRDELRVSGFAIPEEAKKPTFQLKEWSNRPQAFMAAVSRCIGQ